MTFSPFLAAARVRAAPRDEVPELISKLPAAFRIEAIEALSPLTILYEQAGARKNSKMMRDRGLRERESLRQLRNVQPLCRKNRYDSLARRIGERR